MQIKYNISKRKEKIKYIVIHDTGNTARGADARAHFNYFNSGDRSSSADIFADENGVLKINDYLKYCTWHCGDGGGAYGITNQNSVGVELCVNADGDYQKTFKNAAECVRSLMSELNIPIGRVVRHYDASRKNCPASMSKNDWALWKEFKQKISESEVLTMTQYEELKKENEALREEIRALKESGLKVYHYVSQLPSWAVPTVQKLLDKGIYRGESESDLNLPESVMRMLVINDRAGLYD